MLLIVVYVTQKTLDEYNSVIKTTVCPFCHCLGKLIFHGYLRGYSETSSAKIIRGRRIFCNKRKKATGCGRTFSLVLLDYIEGCSISSKTVSSVILRLLNNYSPAAIARDVLVCFSARYIYGLISRLFLRQSFLRSRLLTLRNYDDQLCSDPLYQTLHHLVTAFTDADNPIGHFQLYFQVSFF